MRSIFRALAMTLLVVTCSIAQAESQTIGFNSLQAKQGFPALFQNRAEFTDKVTGVFTRPNNAQGNVPVMIIMHGSAGNDTHATLDRTKFFLDMGIATFVLDSFKQRGIADTKSDQAQLSWAASTTDALMALKTVAAMPGVDPTKIGVIGFSRGGVAALTSGYARVRKSVLGADSNLKFALNISFYGGCAMTGTPDPQQPMMLLVGDKDGSISIDACNRTMDLLRSRGADLKYIVYPGATHAFDITQPRNLYVAREQSWAECGVTYTDLDTMSYMLGDKAVSSKEYGEFNGKCRTTGVNMNYDRGLQEKSWNEVKGFVRKNFAM